MECRQQAASPSKASFYLMWTHSLRSTESLAQSKESSLKTLNNNKWLSTNYFTITLSLTSSLAKIKTKTVASTMKLILKAKPRFLQIEAIVNSTTTCSHRLTKFSNRKVEKSSWFKIISSSFPNRIWINQAIKIKFQLILRMWMQHKKWELSKKILKKISITNTICLATMMQQELKIFP